ncbi:MAG: hypothetical protein ACTSQG_05455 [Promethearchaeota archaeon]
MSWDKDNFEMPLNFIDFSEVYKDAMENWEIIELRNDEYDYLIKKGVNNDKHKYERVINEENKIESLRGEIKEKEKELKDLEKKEKFLKIRENIGKDIKAIFIYICPTDEYNQTDIIILLKFGKVNKLSLEAGGISDLYEGGGYLELTEKNYGDLIYTELLYFPEKLRYNVGSYILRRIKGRPLKLKEWFNKIYAKWVDFNKEIKYPL